MKNKNETLSKIYKIYLNYIVSTNKFPEFIELDIKSYDCIKDTEYVIHDNLLRLSIFDMIIVVSKLNKHTINIF